MIHWLGCFAKHPSDRPLLLDPGNRGLYRKSMKTVKIGRRKRPTLPPDPALLAPAEALPGTREKVALMQARVAAGLPATVPGDVILDPGQARDYTRLRNGYDRLEGQIEDTPEVGVKRVVTHGTTFLKDFKRPLFVEDGSKPNLGERLQEFRESRGLTLGQVAIETGVSKTALLRLESGARRQPHLCLLWALADFFGVTIDELVGRG